MESSMSANLDLFYASLAGESPPRRIGPALAGLWLGLKGRWGDAHSVVQDESDPETALVHAWLHRSEGDHGNAIYWYRRAGVTPVWEDCDKEGRHIARILIDG